MRPWRWAMPRQSKSCTGAGRGRGGEGIRRRGEAQTCRGAAQVTQDRHVLPPLPCPECSQLLVNAKQAKQAKKQQLVAILEQLPDFTMQVRGWMPGVRVRGWWWGWGWCWC